MSIYTRAGDDGTTACFGGRRISKKDPQIEACGSIDEVNANIGHLLSTISETERKKFLSSIQVDLCEIGSILSGATKTYARITSRVKVLENEIDTMEKLLPDLHVFLLPGGTISASLCHVVRTIVRRSERRVVCLPSKKEIQEVVQYLNRLSDYFFVLARTLNASTHTPELLYKKT